MCLFVTIVTFNPAIDHSLVELKNNQVFDTSFNLNMKLIRRWTSERELFMTTSSTTFTQCAQEATEFGEITQNKGHYAV